MTKKIKFSKAVEMDFYSTLNKRVDDYFAINKISKHADWVMVFKTFFYLGIFTGAYLMLILNNNSLVMQFALWITIGFFTAFIGLNISHDQNLR